MNSVSQSNYARTLQQHGLYHPGCGVSAIHLLQALQLEPMTHAERLRTSKKANGASSMGVLIRSCLAVYDPVQRLYRSTEKGTQWLEALKAKKILPVHFSKEAA